ncbi:MAG TPA: PIN domain-containing protein [Chloroflexota bacterium]|nr:PIN domain-containing protein [Chloroflexota bacterium]
MRNALADFLADTNVLVYAYDPADPVKQNRAIVVLAELGARRTGALSTQIMGEFFVTVTRKIQPPLAPAEAERSLVRYARAWPIHDVTPIVVLEAVRAVQRYSISFWDALIWSTAKLNGIPNILSEDFNDGSLLEGVRFLNPFATSFDLAMLRPAT